MSKVEKVSFSEVSAGIVVFSVYFYFLVHSFKYRFSVSFYDHVEVQN